MFDPRDPRSIPQMALLATKPVIILGNDPGIDRLQARFWDRLNAIQAQADSEVLVVGVNRIGIAEACLKHKYKPDVLATVDRPFFRPKTVRDQRVEDIQKATARADEERQMAVLKRTNPKAYEIWEATQAKVAQMEAAASAAQGVKVEQVPTAVTDAFARSFHTCAGASVRVVSQQATWYLQPNFIPGKDIVLNLDQSLTGPADRARMLFTTSDWIVNWMARIGCREFYFYGTSMREPGHCKCLGLTEDDDYSWSEPKRQDTCFGAWDHLKDGFPGLKLYNCDPKSSFVKRGVMEYRTPTQIDPSYQLMSDAETTARAEAITSYAAQTMAPAVVAQMKRAREDSEIAKLRAQMEADKLRAAV